MGHSSATANTHQTNNNKKYSFLEFTPTEPNGLNNLLLLRNMMYPRQTAFLFLALLLVTATESLSTPGKAKFYGGAGVGRLVVDDAAGKENAWKCHYDMVLVERIQGKPPKDSGLFVPQDDLPKLHICKVLALGPGREEENGMVAPMPDIEVGDIVIAKNPWGIGPKDEETADGKKLSFMRSQDIAAKVSGGLLETEEND